MMLLFHHGLVQMVCDSYLVSESQGFDSPPVHKKIDFFCIKSNKVVKDRREKPTGRTCPASWHVDQLCRIAVELELPYENNNNKYKNISTLKKPFILEEFKDLTKIKKHIEEFSKLEVENLRRILYYATSAKPVSCDAIKKYFEENHLLKYDEMCGKPGVKRTEE